MCRPNPKAVGAKLDCFDTYPKACGGWTGGHALKASLYSRWVMQRNAVVRKILSQWSTCVSFECTITHAPAGASGFEGGETVRALAYTDLVGAIAVGERVRIDCSGLAKHLGTGGFATTLATATVPADSLPVNGHIVKARYTPHQVVVQSVEEPDSVHHQVMRAARSLEGMPVIVADLHSSLPAVVAGIRSVQPQARIAYVCDDTAALPLRFSQLCAAMRQAGDLVTTITSGQSFGGDLEAASMPSALLAARHVAHADFAVVTPAPGNLGTQTPWGFSGTAAAQSLHVAHALGGVPIPVLRCSGVDPRFEHRGVSHHCLCVLRQLVLVPLTIPTMTVRPQDWPQDWPQNRAQNHPTRTTSTTPRTSSALQPPSTLEQYQHDLADLAAQHNIHEVDASRCETALTHCVHPLRSMGRTWRQDPPAFLPAAAAGIYATESKPATAK